MENSIRSKKKNLNSSNRAGSIPERKLLKQAGSLEIVDGHDPHSSDFHKSSDPRPPSQSSDRSWSRASMGSIPPRSDSSLSKRTVTPTKQVSLQGIRRKTDSGEPFVDHVDWRDLNHDRSQMSRGQQSLGPRVIDEDECDPAEVAALNEEMKRLRLEREFQKDSPPSGKDQTENEGACASLLSDKEILRRDEKEKEEVEEDDSSSEDEEDEEPRRAPNELLMEFIDCIIKKDFKNADKLCKMILIYEPNNAEALSFKPVIEEKLQLDAEAENEETGDEEDDDDDDDEDDDSDDDSDADSDDDTSSEEDEEDEEEPQEASGSSQNAHNNSNTNAKKNFPYFNSENYQSAP